MSACCNGLSCERPCEHGVYLDQQQCFLCDLEKKIKALEDVDYDERIHDLENIGAESRLLELEKKISSTASISVIHSSNHGHETWKAGFEILINEIQNQITELKRFQDITHEQYKSRKIPYKCPVCDGAGPVRYLHCKPCKGEGIVWG